MKQWIFIGCLLALPGCGGGLSSGHDSAWDTYDYRYAPPGSGSLYDNYGYQDNDEYYRPPQSFGCNPDNIEMCQ